MAKSAQDPLPADVVPCAHFVMSDAFREWAVGEMRREVLGQVSMAGLDRMAIVKGKPAAPGDKSRGDSRDAGSQNHQSKNK